MAHFAEINTDNIVVNVLVVNNNVLIENGDEIEQKGIDFLHSLYGSDKTWVQTSYNNNFRNKFAGIGDVFDSVKNVFRESSHFESWEIGEDGIWHPPVEMPDDGNYYEWDEEAEEWVQI